MDAAVHQLDGRVPRSRRGRQRPLNVVGRGHVLVRDRSSTPEDDRHGMLPGLARFQMRPIVVAGRFGMVMAVGGGAVAVLGVVVVRVEMDVQRRDLAGRGRQGQPEQDRWQAVHGVSLCEKEHGFKPGTI